MLWFLTTLVRKTSKIQVYYNTIPVCHLITLSTSLEVANYLDLEQGDQMPILAKAIVVLAGKKSSSDTGVMRSAELRYHVGGLWHFGSTWRVVLGLWQCS